MLSGLLHLGGMAVEEVVAILSILARPWNLTAHVLKSLFPSITTPFLQNMAETSLWSTIWLSVTTVGTGVPIYLFLGSSSESFATSFGWGVAWADGLAQLVRQAAAHMGASNTLPVALKDLPCPPLGLLAIQLLPIQVHEKYARRFHLAVSAIQLQTAARALRASNDSLSAALLSSVAAFLAAEAAGAPTKWLQTLIAKIGETAVQVLDRCVGWGRRRLLQVQSAVLWVLPRLLRPQLVQLWNSLAPLGLPFACAAFSVHNSRQLLQVVSSIARGSGGGSPAGFLETGSHPAAAAAALAAVPLALLTAQTAILAPLLGAACLEANGLVSSAALLSQHRAERLSALCMCASGYPLLNFLWSGAVEVLVQVVCTAAESVSFVWSVARGRPLLSFACIGGANVYMFVRGDVAVPAAVLINMRQLGTAVAQAVVAIAKKGVEVPPEVMAALGCAALSAVAHHAKLAAAYPVTAAQRWASIVTVARAVCKGVAVPAALALLYDGHSTGRDWVVTAAVGAYYLGWMHTAGWLASDSVVAFTFGDDGYDRARHAAHADSFAYMDNCDKSRLDAIAIAMNQGLPKKIFLGKDDECPICLSPVAVTVAAQAATGDRDSADDHGSGIDIAACVGSLRAGGTAVLSCGHCLHGVCLQGLVQHTPVYRRKCPQCRTPLTYFSAATENVFA